LQPPFRSKQEVIINEPLEAVWSSSMDLTKIPEFHPRVVKVDLLSGKTLREPWLVCTTKAYSGVGADVVMKSITPSTWCNGE